MNKSKRFLCLALAVVLAAMLLTACQPAAEDKTRLDAIKEAGLMTREVLAVAVNGQTCALSAPLSEGDSVTPLTFADPEGKKVF